MQNNDISDFMLKEYEHLAEAYFASHDITAKWVKYYLIVMATPFSFIAFIYKDKPEKFNILALTPTLSILILLVGIIGLLISFVIINTRLDTTLYARAVNGVRKYFTDTHTDNNFKVNYLVLPTDVRSPKFNKIGDLFWLLFIMSLINSFYMSIALPVYGWAIFNSYKPFSQYVIIFLMLLLPHYIYFKLVSTQKERKYPNGYENTSN